MLSVTVSLVRFLKQIQNTAEHLKKLAQMDSDALRLQLAQLRQEHRDLDAAVEALASTSNQDALQLQRLKKKKLMIKDRITALEDQLFPDIIA